MPSTWEMIGTGAAAVAAVTARRTLTAGWEKGTGTKPPANPADPTTEWRQAVLWAVLTGAVIGLVRMLATRQAAVLAKRYSGDLPDDVKRKPASPRHA